MSARATMLRRNLSELLPNFDIDDLGVLLEASGYELVSRGFKLGPGFWAAVHGLLGVQSGAAGNITPIFSGDCGKVLRTRRSPFEARGSY